MADITSDIRGFNTPPEIETTYPTGRIIGAAVIVLALASAGAYSYEKGMWHSAPKQAVPTSELPAPTPQATQNVAPPPAAVSTTPAPQAAPVAAPVTTTTNTIVQTPTKTVRTRVVSHETTTVRRSDTIQKRNAPDHSYVAPNTGNSAVTPEMPSETPTPNPAPQTTNMTAAPNAAAQPSTAPTPSQTTPQQSTPNNTDQPTTPQPQ